MAGLFSNMLHSSLDLVAVFDGYDQVLGNARPIKALVRESARPMEHPVESGVTVTDHRIILPTEIILHVIIESEFYNNTYSQIRNIYKSSSLLSVQTKTGVYNNMIIAEMPHEESPELYDAIPLSIRLKEVFFASPNTYFLPKEEEKSDTVKSGEQSAASVEPPSIDYPQDTFGGQ